MQSSTSWPSMTTVSNKNEIFFQKIRMTDMLWKAANISKEREK